MLESEAFEHATWSIDVRTFQDLRLVPHFTVRENPLPGTHRSLRCSWFADVLTLPHARRAEAHAPPVCSCSTSLCSARHPSS